MSKRTISEEWESVVTPEPRAEEIIAEVYRQKVVSVAAGCNPTTVRLPIVYIRRLRVYRFLLGDLPAGSADYLSRTSLFGLDFVLHDSQSIIVE